MEADAGDEAGIGVVQLRRGFVAFVGLLMSIMFLLLIIAEGLGPFFLSPCPTEGLTVAPTPPVASISQGHL